MGHGTYVRNNERAPICQTYSIITDLLVPISDIWYLYMSSNPTSDIGLGLGLNTLDVGYRI